MERILQKSGIVSYFNATAAGRDHWRRKNWYYHADLFKFFDFNIRKGSSVLEIGCGTGELLRTLKPKEGTGIDLSAEMIKLARSKDSGYDFRVDDIEDLKLEEKFDYVIMQDLIGHMSDVWHAFRNLRKVTAPETRVIITYYNHLWEPVIFLLEKLGLKMRQPYLNWLALSDIEQILALNHFEVIKSGNRLLFPFYIPLVSYLINTFLAKLPLLRKLCLIKFIIARQTSTAGITGDYSCSVVIPTRNEAGNIDSAVSRMPAIGKSTEIIFVDGNSTDGTPEKIRETIEKNPGMIIKFARQEGTGKGDAVRKGFSMATGDILMILDADLTVPPEDLPKFYLALAEGRGEFINGTRLVYPMEKGAMRPLNMIGNKVFSIIFTWILEQRIKDTLCGTKALFRKDYLAIADGREYFGDFDPFGDFDLLFGAAKQNLRIVEMPVRYRERTYGSTKISRFKHGLLLLKMSALAFGKFKLY